MTRYLTIAEVVHLHRELMLASGRAAVMIARDKLEGAVARPDSQAFGEEFFPDVAAKAAALLQGVVIAHAFMDGNKRAGLTSMIAFLRLNGFQREADQDALYDLVIRVTTGELREVDEIAPIIAGLFAAGE